MTVEFYDQTPVSGLPLQLFEAHFGRPCFGQCDSVGWCLSTGDFLRPKSAVPPSFYPLTRGWVYFVVPEASLIRGIPTGPKLFLAMLDARGLGPCDWTHHKNGFVPNLCSVGCVIDKWRLNFITTVDLTTCMLSFLFSFVVASCKSHDSFVLVHFNFFFL